MRTLIIALALVFVFAGATFAVDTSLDIFAGTNMVGISRVPFDPAPVNIFDEFTVFELGGNLYRWDPTTQSYPAALNPFNPAAFGNCLLGDGYWFTNVKGVTVTVTYAAVADGVPDGVGTMTDMWVTLPGNQVDGLDEGGQHMIGQPFEHDTPLNNVTPGDNVFLTDGIELKTFAAANAAGWCDNGFWYWDNAADMYGRCAPFFAPDNTLRKNTGYWFSTNKDNLALIIPAY